MNTYHKEGYNDNINNIVGCYNWTEVSNGTAILRVRVYGYVQQTGTNISRLFTHIHTTVDT